MRQFKYFPVALFALALAGSAHAQTFTYQGSLKDAGAPANGLYDLQFALFDAPIDGIKLTAWVQQDDVNIVDGLFTAELPLGAAINGADRWLAIKVNGTTLSPRTKINPAPMAIFAMKPWE